MTEDITCRGGRRSTDAPSPVLRRYRLPGGTITTAPLYSHQIIGVATLVAEAKRRGYYALTDECGLGKTIQAIYTARDLIAAGLADRLIVVAKCDLIRNWYEELKVHAPEMQVQTLQGKPPGKRIWASAADAYLINYVLLGAKPGKGRGTVVSAFTNRRIEINRDGLRMAEALQQFRCVLVLDESQKIKSRTAHTTATLCSLAPLATVRMILTGTLAAESPLDVWSQIHFLDGGKLLGRSYKAFNAKHSVYETRHFRNRVVQKVVGYKNLDVLRDQIGTVSLRRLKSQCLDLPAKVHKVRYLTPGDSQARLLRSIRDELVESVQGEDVAFRIRPGTPTAGAMQRLQRASAMPSTVDPNVTGSAKLRGLLALLDETNEPVVVWCIHRDVTEAVSVALNRQGIRASYIHGGIPVAARRTIVDRLGKDIRVLVCTADSMREGHNLQAAGHAAYMQLGWSRLNWVQSQDRIHRIGQSRTVVVERLLMPQSLDMYIWNRVLAKVKASESTDGDAMTDTVVIKRDEFIDALTNW